MSRTPPRGTTYECDGCPSIMVSLDQDPPSGWHYIHDSERDLCPDCYRDLCEHIYDDEDAAKGRLIAEGIKWSTRTWGFRIDAWADKSRIESCTAMMPTRRPSSCVPTIRVSSSSGKSILQTAQSSAQSATTAPPTPS